MVVTLVLVVVVFVVTSKDTLCGGGVIGLGIGVCILVGGVCGGGGGCVVVGGDVGQCGVDGSCVIRSVGSQYIGNIGIDSSPSTQNCSSFSDLRSH